MWLQEGNSSVIAPIKPLLADAYLEQRDALGRFFRARLGGGHDVEDLLQDLYLKVSQIDPGMEIRDPRAFLYRLASNLLLDRRRSSLRSATRDGAWRLIAHTEGDGADIDEAPSAETVVESRQRLAALVRAMETLPVKTAAIFRMHKFEDLSYAEVAARLKISRSSVEKHMMDALRILAVKTHR
ncbi:MAG: sigma-70 family RNA polymerase sigma factor [Brevundimonas sp.]|nr:MAG: sigma-70 family RNA polymerase sigma factor [Brevundimonas sp.]